MKFRSIRRRTVKTLLLSSTATLILALAPVDFVNLDYSFAVAAGGQGGGGGGNGGGGGGGSSGGGGGGSSDRGHDSDGGEAESSVSKSYDSPPGASSNSGARKGKAKSNLVAEPSKGMKSSAPESSMRPKGSKVTTAEDDTDSDRPEWAGVPGGKDGAGGGKPPTSGSTKGDLFGDLFVILRDDNGVPILTDEGWVQPLDAEGNLIALDEEGHPLDESLTVEVELGRLNVGRAPTHVLTRRADEVITLLNLATDIRTDPAGRLELLVDDVWKTIDSPLENLAIYVALVGAGTIEGVDDLPGEAFDFMVDGVWSIEDIQASASFLAAATDKSGEFTTDEIAYINAFLGIETETIGNVTYTDLDYSTFSYDRESLYGDVTTEVLVLSGGDWVVETVNIYEAVFGSEPMIIGDDSATPDVGEGTLEAYMTAAEDARLVINFIHEYAVPEDPA
ncbi:hypothetical protein [Aliiruegeria lutimaris]|nr:hypothetical protein [Aliiruegeria lutimaris]